MRRVEIWCTWPQVIHLKKKDISGFYIFEKRNQNVASDVYHKRAKGQQLHGIVLPLA
jgi:hypothetical protein